MNGTLSIEKRNRVLRTMAELLEERSEIILSANAMDIDLFDPNDRAMYDRLKVDQLKVQGMIASLGQLASQEDPLGRGRFSFVHENGLRIENRTAPFGTVLIIYESRPDVTVEAAGIAFKSGNKILLKGGKESLNSNLAIVDLWHEALRQNEVETDWISYMKLNRDETRGFLKHPTEKVDLIIPRGGEKLIQFVKQNASCPVIVSGRGNNYAYVHLDADPETAIRIIVNAKTDKISACNALDKVLIHKNIPDFQGFLEALELALEEKQVEIMAGKNLNSKGDLVVEKEDPIWYEEFLDYKILIDSVESEREAVDRINKYGGGHSATVITRDEGLAMQFMDQVDAAAVYHNASTRFTDGFQFGLGGELAISTDKLHQRGPIGLEHLVTNKWYIYGEGQIR
jgi:glutamate-5-semialdehyde dehydrogenase